MRSGRGFNGGDGDRPGRRWMLAGALVLAGCTQDGLSPGAPDGGGASDLAAVPPADLARPDLATVDLAPAPHAALPQIPFNGGRVLDNVSLVTITWAGDPLEATLQGFDQWIPGSDYFLRSLNEYSVKSGAQAAAWSIPKPAPMTLDDRDIQSTLKALIDAKTIPGVTPDRLYNVYLPDGVTFTADFGGAITYTACTDFLSYHNVGPTVAGGPIIYAVTPRCHQPGLSDLDYATWNGSGVLARAATDPTYTGWFVPMPDATTPFGGDVASLCQSFLLNQDGHAVTALYSNRAARQELRPCIPAPGGPMFGAPSDPDTLQLPPGGAAKTTLHVYTTAPLPKPLKLTVAAYPLGQITAKASSVLVQSGDSVTVDVSLGKNAKSGTQAVVILRTDAPDYHWENYILVYVL